MKDSGRLRSRKSSLGGYVWILIGIWSLTVLSLLFWSISREIRNIEELAILHARSALQKDLVYRRWAALHGGVYVPVTEENQPNPYLQDVPERDLTTPSGQRLTLVNPAYMTRQVQTLGSEEYGLKGHITSLRVIRSENAPDDWEKKALESFEKGTPEFSSVEAIDGNPYLRLMKPLVTEKSCLKCHTKHGYTEGSIRGGISVSVPLDPIVKITSGHIFVAGIGHTTIWVLGLLGITLGGRRLKHRIEEQDRMDARLREELDVNTALADLANALISAPTSVADIAFMVLARAKALTASEHGYVSSIDPETKAMAAHTNTEMMGTQCRLPEEDQKIVFPIGNDGRYPSLWGHSLNTRRPFYTNSPDVHEASGGTPAGHIPIRRFLSVPAIVEGEVVGQISLANPADDYTDRDLETIQRLSDLFALAIQRVRTEEQTINVAKFPSENTNPVLRIGRNGQVLYANPPGKLLLTEWNTSVGDLVPPFWGDKVSEALDTGVQRSLDTTCKDRVFSFSIVPIVDGGYVNLYGTDITERKRAEETVELSRRILDVANRHTKLIPMFQEVVSELKSFSECEAVGVRMLTENGSIPYQAYQGFPREFYELESPLWMDTDSCVCINVIKGTTDPSLPFYTPQGSFYMNGTTRFLATVDERDKGETRNTCNRFGYESVALIPVRVGRRIIGLVHLADRSENKVPLRLVETLEKVAGQIGTAVQRVSVEQALKEAHDTLEKRVMERTEELAISNEQLMEEIAERMQAEKALYEQSSILEAFFKHTITPLAFLDRQFKISRVNQAYAEICRMDAADIPTHSVFEFFPIDAKPTFEEVVNAKSPFQTTAVPLIFPRCPEGGVTYWDWMLVPITDDDGNIEFLVFSLTDVTRRKEAEAELLALHQQLVNISDEERRRIGQDLHDNLGQQLAGIGMLLKSLHKRLQDQQLPETEATSRILTYISTAQKAARSIATGLVPVQVGAQGLMAALESLASDVSDLSGIPCRFDFDEPVSVDDNTVATHLFRIAQEAVNNAVRHGRPDNICVRLRRQNGNVILQTLDDGIGISTEKANSTGMGLRIMRHRADIIGGILTVNRGEHGGTVITCMVNQEHTQK